jgi:ParB-like nuclease domain
MKAPAKTHANGPRIVMADARELKPSPENELLYRERTLNDSDYARLVESVHKDGVQAPLLVSQDGYIISGHQRGRAAIATERYSVPVIYLNIRRSDYTRDQWLAILREHNCGREKSFDELIRENLIDIDPDEAVRQIVDDKVRRSRSRAPTIEVSAKQMTRWEISAVKRQMADAVLQVLRDLEDYLPVSLRAIHYRLVDKSILRNVKEGTPYGNDLASYKDLSNLVTRMRLAGEIYFGDVCDETRPVTIWAVSRNAADFVKKKSEGFLTGYARDLMQSQQVHFEIVVEKLTVQNFVRPIAGQYRMPLVVMRGNSGIDARYKMVERFKASGKSKLFLFCLGDCDPDGDSIVESTLRSLRDDFGVKTVEGTRVAMKHDQADALHLPHMLEAKTTSPNYRKFVKKHGRNDCYELEAVAPDVLQQWLDAAIRNVIDVEAYNHEVEQQKADAAGILAHRKAALEVMKNSSSD